ncbi:MAG: hypothetical protein ACRDG8_09455 [Actinomycetota bacterium]
MRRALLQDGRGCRGITWRTGALLGVAAAVVMGMFAMLASATYHDTGFFTPLHHIASALIEPNAMMRSMEAGMAGDTFTISVGPALLGLTLHLATGAFWGAIFELPARARRWFERHLLDCEDCWREVLPRSLRYAGRGGRARACPGRAPGQGAGRGPPLLRLSPQPRRLRSGASSPSTAVRMRLGERLTELLSEAAVTDDVRAVGALAEGAEVDQRAAARTAVETLAARP